MVDMSESVAGPRCYGQDPGHQQRYAVACRASAVILDREGHHEEAGVLRERAAAAAGLMPGCGGDRS